MELVDERLLTAEDGGPTTWPAACQRLADVQSYWLATVHPAGHPHVRPLLGVVLDGNMYFCTSANARKGRNLDHENRCAITATCQDLDMVVEGAVVKVTDDDELGQVTATYRAKYGWPVQPAEDGTVTAEYVAPTAGDPPYYVYRLTPETVFGFPTKQGFGPMRWRFQPSTD